MNSSVLQPCKFIGTKESVYIRKELNFDRIAAVLLFWNNNMAAMTSCAYDPYTE